MTGNALSQHCEVIGIYPCRDVAGQALDQLILSGFPIAQVFMLSQDGDDSLQQTSSVKLASSSPGVITGTATGLRKGMLLGNLVGGATGLLLGVGLIALPGVGQLMLSSAIAFTLLSGGVCTAAGGLIGALIGLGMTSEQAKTYSRQVANGKVLLLVEGTVREINCAQRLLNQSIS
jgi:hypothetical protein